MSRLENKLRAMLPDDEMRFSNWRIGYVENEYSSRFLAVWWGDTQVGRVSIDKGHENRAFRRMARFLAAWGIDHTHFVEHIDFAHPPGKIRHSDYELYTDTPPPGGFRCSSCGRTKPAGAIGRKNKSGVTCATCTAYRTPENAAYNSKPMRYDHLLALPRKRLVRWAAGA